MNQGRPYGVIIERMAEGASYFVSSIIFAEVDNGI
jgi:hypothetical protein